MEAASIGLTRRARTRGELQPDVPGLFSPEDVAAVPVFMHSDYLAGAPARIVEGDRSVPNVATYHGLSRVDRLRQGTLIAVWLYGSAL
jgi:hypothetical protein